MSERKYIRWDAEGVEKIPPNEQEDIQKARNQLEAGVPRCEVGKGRHYP